jgi:hypothetical protein
MDSQVELQPRTRELHALALAATALEPQPDPRVEAARGAALRHLFPKHRAGRGSRAASRAALRRRSRTSSGACTCRSAIRRN